MQTPNSTPHRPPSSGPPVPPTRRLTLEIPTGLEAFSDADVRLGIADAWGNYLEALRGFAPSHVRAARVRELAFVVVELLRRTPIGDCSDEPI